MKSINQLTTGIAVGLCLLTHSSFAADSFPANSQPAGFLQPMAMSTNNLTQGAKGYRPWFENGSWQGDLVEYDITATGAISSSVDLLGLAPTNTGSNWSARLQFSAAEAANSSYWQTSRKIITWDGTNQVAFRWSNLSDPQKQQLDNVSFASNATSSPILDFIRGDRSNEKPTGTLRTRYNLLGDIMHSNPVYVGAPNSNFTESSYINFQNTNASRSPRIYVGANDGMLHVFDAETGNEVYAFIPPALIDKLDNLAADPYGHEYYVDGELSVYDTFFSGSWHTILTGSLGAGGSTRFALDVTNPDLSAETSNTGTNKKILWLQDNGTDPALGDAYGQATLVKLNDNKYYSIVGNGYNSARGIAQLMLTEVKTGVITKISTLTGSVSSPNGLSTPAVVDTDGNGTFDYAYAGDLDGNLWKFDLSAKTLAYSAPLYAAGNSQPITTKPSVARHPNGGKLVFFGTGKILSASDLTDTTTQAMYGIWDTGSTPGTANLLIQTLSADLTIGSQTIKTLTATQVNWSTHTGWKVELTGGKRVVTNHQLRAGRLQTSVTNPVTEENWLFEPSYLNGGAPSQTIFDINKNGSLEASDNVNDGTLAVNVASAWKVATGIMSGPVIARIDEGIDTKFLNIEVLPLAPIPCTSGCGFLGGHIDVDTDAPPAVGNGFAGSTTAHTHEYDKVVLQPYVDYFEVNQGKAEQLQIDEVITDKDKKFFVILANADLSSKSTLNIGTVTYNVVEYQRMIQRKLETWDGQLTTLKDDDGNSLIVSINELQAGGGTLRNSFDSHSILDGGLHPTQTGCVRGKDGKPVTITNGRWRNGALITQLIDPGVVSQLSDLYLQTPTDLPVSVVIDGQTIFLKEDVNGDGVIDNNIDGDSNIDIYGGLRAKGSVAADAPANGMLYESSLFWHYGDIAKFKGDPKVCYGEAGWEQGVASERAGLTEAQLTQILTDADFESLYEVMEELDSLVAICASAADVGKCQKDTKINNVKIKDLIKNLQKIIDLSAAVDDGTTSGDGLTPGSIPVLSGVPLVITGGNKSTGITAGPNFKKGRRTWVDITNE